MSSWKRWPFTDLNVGGVTFRWHRCAPSHSATFVAIMLPPVRAPSSARGSRNWRTSSTVTRSASCGWFSESHLQEVDDAANSVDALPKRPVLPVIVASDASEARHLIGVETQVSAANGELDTVSQAEATGWTQHRPLCAEEGAEQCG